MTPEEEMKLLLLDADCKEARQPWNLVGALLSPAVLLDIASPFVRRWRLVRRLRSDGVDVERRGLE